MRSMHSVKCIQFTRQDRPENGAGLGPLSVDGSDADRTSDPIKSWTKTVHTVGPDSVNPRKSNISSSSDRCSKKSFHVAFLWEHNFFLFGRVLNWLPCLSVQCITYVTFDFTKTITLRENASVSD
jgi:hypothetical protein